MAEGITLQEMDKETVADLATKDEVGPLTELLTTAKSNTVTAINELFTDVSDGKNAVAAAITGKGVSASGSDTFVKLATKISQIVPQPVMEAGNNMIFNSWNGYWYSVSYYGSVWEKRYTIRIGLKGTYRVKFGLYAYNSQSAFGQLYRNGVPYGSQRINNQYQVKQYYTQDLYFDAGDTLELWVRNQGSGGADYATPVVYGSLSPYAISEPAPTYAE